MIWFMKCDDVAVTIAKILVFAIDIVGAKDE